MHNELQRKKTHMSEHSVLVVVVSWGATSREEEGVQKLHDTADEDERD